MNYLNPGDNRWEKWNLNVDETNLDLSGAPERTWTFNLLIRRPEIFKSNQFASILDTTKIKEHLGYEPKISLEKLKSKAKAYKT